MNTELEKLVNITLADGYISDKEREVLKRKAVTMGFDVDELEIILDGKLYEISQKNTPKVNKCPSCGEIISGFTRVCPSCDYILNTTNRNDYETIEESFSELEELVKQLKNYKPKPDSAPLFGANLKIIFTWGLYIIYKKLIKKENIYDSYRDINKTIIVQFDDEVKELRRKYGNNPQTEAVINSLITQRDAIINARRKSDITSGLTGFGVIAAIIAFIFYLGNLPPAPLSSEEKLQKLIADKKIAPAKAMLLNLEEKPENSKEYYVEQIQLLEIDSLSGAGNYNEALRLANLIKDGDYSDNREKKIDEIITKEVTELIEKKEFKKAKEKAGLASYLVNSKLEDQIKVAEKIK